MVIVSAGASTIDESTSASASGAKSVVADKSGSVMTTGVTIVAITAVSVRRKARMRVVSALAIWTVLVRQIVRATPSAVAI